MEYWKSSASATAGMGNNDMQPTILYEDESVLAIGKPAGMVVHPDGIPKNADVPSVTAWLQGRYPGIENVGGLIDLASGGTMPRSGTVHRIDRETSGVLVIAKTQAAFEFLQKQFIERRVEKTYRAFLYGTLEKKEGVIDLPIGRSREDFRRYTSLSDSRDKKRDAETFYKVLAEGKDASFVEAKPKTGRTHQLRVHFLAIGHPVVADKLYAKDREKILGFDRLALHAFSIVIELPSGEKKTIEAPLPQDFDKALAELRK